jgi:hypothetical protein
MTKSKLNLKRPKVENMVEIVAEKLHSKAELKQKIYANLKEFFKILKIEASQINTELTAKTQDCNPKISVAFNDVSDFEFRITAGGDTIVAVMQSNIILLDPEHAFLKRKYFKENPPYFGQIVLYNFLEDSFRYNRMNDYGYLIGRIFIDANNRLFAEGDRQVHYCFDDPDNAFMTNENARLLLLKGISAMIDNDLMAPEFQHVQVITLAQKENYTITEARGQKIGFQANYNAERDIL